MNDQTTYNILSESDRQLLKNQELKRNYVLYPVAVMKHHYLTGFITTRQYILFHLSMSMVNIRGWDYVFLNFKRLSKLLGISEMSFRSAIHELKTEGYLSNFNKLQPGTYTVQIKFGAISRKREVK